MSITQKASVIINSKGGHLITSNSQSQNSSQDINHNPSSKPPSPIDKTSLEKTFGEYTKQQEEQSAKNKASVFGVKYINLTAYPIQTENLAIIPKKIAQKYHVISFHNAKGRLRVGSTDPKNEEMVKYISHIASQKGFEPEFVLISKSSFNLAFDGYRSISGYIESKTEDIEVKKKAEAEFEKEIKNLADLKEKITSVSTTKLFDIIIAGALKTSASDIHVEPAKDGMRLRYRIDGVLQDVTQLPISAFRALLSRIKYLAKLTLDIKDQPQNGRFSIKSGSKMIDIRVSTLPTMYGENIVMRLLVHGLGFLNLDELGFSKNIRKLVDKAIERPAGLIINCGPTGSGKTTTLYAILDHLNKPGKKIITLEDPVEYRISGITQTQINPRKGLDFATSLKSSLRQDPDILMVGEVRDLQTAEAAISAGMTGHLVLTTLHTNNAVAAMPRLMDLGIKPFLLSGNILLIIAQRLVRKLCLSCRVEYKPSLEQVKAIKNAFSQNKKFSKIKIPDKLYNSRGCPKCNNTGFSGRTPIAEALKPNKETEKMVKDRATITELYNKAIELGMITMEQDGLQKAIQGVTTIDEVWRVTAAKN